MAVYENTDFADFEPEDIGPDYEDVLYEDSVSSDTYEDSRDYEMWSPEDCAAENVGEF